MSAWLRDRHGEAVSSYTPTTDEIREVWGRHSRYMEFDCWLASVKAEAWAEGFDAGEDEAYEHEARLQWSMPHTCISNPYREETE